jgi:Ser/Thr protein kinase RdoA (MazF antagonist)
MTETLEASLLSALNRRARQALTFWNVPPQEPVLLKYRENAVFRIELAGGRFAALRLHRPGYHGIAALRSELEWMAALHDDGIDVPHALPNQKGEPIVELPADETFPLQYADIVSWVDGEQFGETGRPLNWNQQQRVALFGKIGAGMAAMHNSADRFQPQQGFYRPAWDAEGLLGQKPLWGRFWDCDFLSPAHKTMLSALRVRLSDELAKAELHRLDYGLIHADLIRENILIKAGEVSFIDFDDCGYGFRMFDIATALLKNHNEPDFAALSDALVAGYREHRHLPDEALAFLPLFLTLRSLTYIGWLAERPEMPDMAARLERYVEVSSSFAKAGGFLN